MKRYLKIVALVLASASCLVACADDSVTEDPTQDSEEFEFYTIVVGTTAQIERAVAGEYEYDLLCSGTSRLPLLGQDETGALYPVLASYQTED
ncbi:MAG: hypothetical protein ACI4U2_02655, partial [Christensenellaceae bacterium]